MSNTIRIKKSELQDSKNALKFVRVFGKEKYRETLTKISKQHFGDGSLERLIALSENVSDEKYGQIKGKIEEEMSKLVPPKKDVEVEIEVEPADLEFHKQQAFIDLFGPERFFEAQGLKDMQQADIVALKRSNPIKIREEQQRQAEAKKAADAAAAAMEAEKEALKEAGVDVDE